MADNLQRFYQLNQVPDFNNYLVYILTKLLNEQEYIRTIAGLLLKNNVKSNWTTILPEVRAYIKGEMLQCLGDPMESVRHTVGSIITTIVMKEDSLDEWPGLLQTLVHFLDAPDPHVVDGAFSAFTKLCEDSSSKLAAFGNGAVRAPFVFCSEWCECATFDTVYLLSSAQALQVILPKLLSFFQSPHERFRNYAIRCMNFFVIDMPPSFDAEAYMRGIFHLANDPSPAVRERVCHAFVLLLDVRLNFLMPFLREVVQYMMACTNDTAHPQLALEACEFWYVLSDAKVCEEVLRDSLPQLVPILLKAMVYGTEELATLRDVERTNNNADRPQDIRPRHHKSRAAGAAGKPGTGGGGGGGEGSDDDDDDGDDDEEVSEWNLRKSAAAALDSLASVFEARLLPILFPVLQDRLRSPEWIVRESAILAIGAVAEGCSAHMTAQLPALIQFLLSQLQDKQPLIRSITCWTIGRYSNWIAEQDHNQFLRPVINDLLRCILDANKKVQEAACSAFATLEEEAADELLPYLGLILQHLMFAYSRYQAKNLIILYDAIATLADSIGSNLNQQQFIDILLPPLIQTWNELGDHDEKLFPLLECLTSVVIALGTGFLVYATPVFLRCLRLIETALVNQATGAQQEKDFAVCALDLISGLAEGLRSTMEHVVGDQAQHLAMLLLQCANDSVAEVRQSTFALVGDLARTSMKLLLPIMAPLMQFLAVNIANASVRVGFACLYCQSLTVCRTRQHATTRAGPSARLH